jgi:hypothetical protein
MTVHHYLYEGWPDFGVPRGKDVEKLQELIKEVGRKQKEEAAGGCEVWVHWYVFPSLFMPLLIDARGLIPIDYLQLGRRWSYRNLHCSYIAPQPTNVPIKRLLPSSTVQIASRAFAGTIAQRHYRLACRSVKGTAGGDVSVGCSSQVAIRVVYREGPMKAITAYRR